VALEDLVLRTFLTISFPVTISNVIAWPFPERRISNN